MDDVVFFLESLVLILGLCRFVLEGLNLFLELDRFVLAYGISHLEGSIQVPRFVESMLEIFDTLTGFGELVFLFAI